MADSVDRVFVHALNTVKRIPRLGSARPPPESRLKLYGLYKQSMEGDVGGVMERPAEGREEQNKWDAWFARRGLSKTQAKGDYIEALIETMHKYASQTPDAKALLTELEFVWSQIKSNSPAQSSSSHSPSNSQSNSDGSYPYRDGHRVQDSPPSSSDPAIYPLMSERGSRNPRAEKAVATDGSRLRMLSPRSQYEGEAGGGAEEFEGDREGDEDDTELEAEDFVDAPDSQIGMNDVGASGSEGDDEDAGRNGGSPAQARRRGSPGRSTQHIRQTSILGTLAKYLTVQKQETAKLGDTTTKWQRRMEGALIKMNAEMAAVREQMDMQASERARGGSVYESLVYPFAKGRRRRGWLGRGLDFCAGVLGLLVRHFVVDLTLLVLITVWLHYRGIPAERLEDSIGGWIRQVQSWRLLKRWERIKVQQARAGKMVAKSVSRSFPNLRSGGG